jgi:hypothetical protein
MSYDPIDEYPLRKLTAKARLAAALLKAERAKLETEGKELVLCPPDCPEKKGKAEHAHTWWDMWRMREKAAYEAELVRRADELDAGEPMVNTAALLERAGVGQVHLEGLKRLQRGHAKGWAALMAARLWVHQERPWLQPDAYGQPGRLGALPLPWLVLLGPTGRGKTQAAVYAMERWARGVTQSGVSGERPVPKCMLVQGAEMAELSLPSWQAKYGTEERLEDVLRTPFLVLDDLTLAVRQGGGGPALTLLLRILDYRYSHKRYTVLTDNSTAQDFEARLDFNGNTPRGQEGMGRIWRRCVEAGFVLDGQELTAGGKKVPLVKEQKDGDR